MSVFERGRNHNKIDLEFNLFSMLPALVDIDGVRNMYLRRTQRISSKGERHDAAKDALPHNFISVSSA